MCSSDLEVASAFTIEALKAFYQSAEITARVQAAFERARGTAAEAGLVDDSPHGLRLRKAVESANISVYRMAQQHEQLRDMGTTVVAIHFDDEYSTMAHVGDSRCYRLRRGELKQMTEDHSLLNDYKKMAVLTPEEEANFPHKNIIVRACGLKDNVVVDIDKERPERGDVYILCSDGLSGEVTDPQIQQIMVEAGTDLQAMVSRLIQTACDNGGKDNVTCIAVRVDDV